MNLGPTSQRLAEARRAAGKTQAELATELGVRERTVERWEAGTHKPDRRYLRDLAEALDVTVLALLEDDPNGDDEPIEAVA